MDWDQVQTMVESGLVSVGSHTVSHLILSRCSPERVTWELRESRDLIERKTSERCRFFCYPNGAAGDFNAQTMEQLAADGYECGLTTVPGLNGKSNDALELQRFGAPGDLAQFSATVSGVRKVLSRALAVVGKC